MSHPHQMHAAAALPGGHDRCQCGDLASTHDIGARKGAKVRTACAHSSCDCRSYRPAESPTEGRQ